jgi:hypothetical protein
MRWMLTIGFWALTLNVTACCHEAELPQAVRGLYSREVRERNQSLQLIAQCGGRAETIESSVPRIAALMYDQNVGVASSAAYALRRINTDGARAALKTAEEGRNQRRASLR